MGVAPPPIETNEWANQFLLPHGTRSRCHCLNVDSHTDGTPLNSSLPFGMSISCCESKIGALGAVCGENGRKSEDGQKEK